MDFIEFILTFLLSLVTLLVTVGIHRNTRRYETLLRCDSFQREISQRYYDLKRYYCEHKLDEFFINYFSGKEYKPSKQMQKDVKYYIEEIRVYLNEIDSFSMFILDRRNCNEELAFSMQGNMFCTAINSIYKIYELFAASYAEDYKSLIHLYTKWSERIKNTTNKNNLQLFNNIS